MYKQFKKYLQRKLDSYKTLKGLYAIYPKYIKSRIKKKFINILEFFYLLILLPVCLPIIVILRISKPILTIRLGRLESEGIGHFSQPVEIYLCEQKSKLHERKVKTLDIWYLDKLVCNEALLLKWREVLIIAPRIIKPLHLLNRMIPGGNGNEIPYRRITENNPWQCIDCHGVLEKIDPHIRFSKIEEKDCTDLLLESGFDSKNKYVCFNVRDSAFHGDEGQDSHRNSSINDYHDAIKYLNILGYQVVRMGAKVEEELTLNNTLIFDYATSGIRSDLLDLYLISKCSFYVGTGSGLDVVSSLFRKRQLYLNISEIFAMPWYSYNSILLFQKFKKEGKIISYPLIFENGYHNYSTFSQYKNSNIELIRNSNQEIRNAILEIDSRLEGKWKKNKNDEANQKLFISFFPVENHKKFIKARVGSIFLRDNISLLS